MELFRTGMDKLEKRVCPGKGWFQMEQQTVWERVNQEPVIPREPLRRWLLDSLETEAWFRAQAAAARGTERETLCALADREAQNGGCLRGMLLSAGLTPPRRTAGPARFSLPDMLTRCRRAYRNYAGMTPDPEFGMVFVCMAERQAAQTEGLLHLLSKGFTAR